MLNKSKSNNLNLLKYAFILPLLGMFLMSFNTKEVYLNESSFNNIQTIGNAEIVIINKDFTDAALEKIKKTFKKNNVELHFKGIKRNDLNEIIALKIEGVSKKSKTNFNSNSSKAIKPIKITYNSDNESISIGSIDDNTIFITEDNTTKIVKSGAGSTVFITSEDNTNTSNNATVIIEEENNKETKVAINKLEEEANDTNIFKAEANKNKLKINTEVDSGIVVYIDGKKSTKDAMEALDPNHIASMHVYKGDKMTKEFGPQAKEGIIMITTK